MHSSADLQKSDDKKTPTITDPVCGMTVNLDSAVGCYEHNGQTYYFCSTHCLHKFRASHGRIEWV